MRYGSVLIEYDLVYCRYAGSRLVNKRSSKLGKITSHKHTLTYNTNHIYNKANMTDKDKEIIKNYKQLLEQLQNDNNNLHETAKQYKQENEQLKQKLNELLQKITDLSNNQLIRDKQNQQQISALNENIQKLAEQNKDLIEQIKNLHNPNKKQKTDEIHMETDEINTQTPQNTDKQTPYNIPKSKITHLTNLQKHNEQITQINNTQPHTSPQTSIQNTQQTTNEQKTIPIIIRDTKNWPSLNKNLKNNFDIDTPKKVGLGIQLNPKNPTQHRQITKHLTDNNIEYHTFLLPDERDLNIIIKGLPKNFDIQDIKTELEERGFHPKECYRMVIGTAKVQTSMVKCRLPKEQTNIYKITDLFNLKITVEPQKSNNTNYKPQCKRCQKFGHTESRCNATPQCNRCEGKHYYKQCQVPKTEKAFCINCKGAHASNYAKCPKNPRMLQKTTQQTSRQIPTKPVQTNISYSSITQQNTKTQQNTQTQSQTRPQQNQGPNPLTILTLSNAEIEAKIKFLHTTLNKYPDIKQFLNFNGQ